MIGERRAEYAGFGTRELFVDGAGPTLVLIHGFAQPAPCWRAVLERAERAGHRAVAVDLPGFGDADPLSAGPRLPQLVNFLRAVITAHGAAAPVVVVGNSLGASTAVRLLDAEPDLPVRGLVALSTATDKWTALVRAAMLNRGRMLVLIGALRLPAMLVGHGAHRVGARLLYGDYRLADAAAVALLAEPLGSPRIRRDLAMLSGQLVTEVAEVATARDLAYPTVFVHGTRDKLVSVAASRNLHAANQGSRLEVLEGVGHCPHLDAPDRIAELAFELTGRAARDQTETA